MNQFDGTWHMEDGRRLFADKSEVGGVNNWLAMKNKKSNFQKDMDTFGNPDVESSQEKDLRAKELADAAAE
jgi:hypothetical protein